MRKSLLFGAILLVASCTVQKEEEFQSPSQHRYHAVAEEPVDAETRVYADSKLRVRWNEGDHISIFERKTYNQEFEFLGDTGDTAGDFDPVESSGYHSSGDIEDGHVYAIYPYDKKNKCDYDGKLTVTFPSVQHYKKDSFGVGANVMVAKTNTMDLRFMHVGGYRTFKLYGEGVSVSSVRIESNGPEYLSGRADVVLGEDGKPAVSFIESTSNSNSVELVCDTPVALGATDAEAVEFWFVLPPGPLAQGFTVTVTDENGNEFTKSTSNSVEIKSGVKKSMPAFEVEIENEPVISVPEPVDLGLPSGLKWASFNLGASAPEDWGYHFAWGETEPYYSNYDFYTGATWKDGKSAGYDWASYKWCNGSETSITKYNTIDNKTVLDPEDDAAHVILGGNWRMATFEEWIELYNYSDWESDGTTTVVTSRVNGNQILLPGPGGGGFFMNTTCYGGCIYWSSSHFNGYNGGARDIQLSSFQDLDYLSGRLRFCGLYIRPVYDQGVFVPMESVSLNETSLSLHVGESARLIASIVPSNTTQHLIFSSNAPSVVQVDITRKVTAIGVGTATITAQTNDGSVRATCEITVSEMSLSEGESIDLGLPSGLKWASCNLCESGFVDAPEAFGDYYAWGETEPYYTEGHSQDNPCDSWKDGKSTGYSMDSYQWFQFDGSDYHITKYDAAVDNKTVLEENDDAAHVKLGGSWRIPTSAEWTELIDNCTWIWFTLNGVPGCLVTSNLNGNNIFLPAAGERRDNTFLPDMGSEGEYCSSSLGERNSWNAMALGFGSYKTQGRCQESYGRHLGRSVRPVSDSETEIVGEEDGEW